MNRPLTVSSLLLSFVGTTALAQPDVGLCDIQAVMKWGSEGDVTAYSIGATAVNVGPENLAWVHATNAHPVIGQNMFRIRDGRIEQVGQSWLKHAICALQLPGGCGNGCAGGAGCLAILYPGCQSVSSATMHGYPPVLGPKWQVNANTGVFTWPHDTPAVTTIAGRLQVHNDDLGDPDAVYLVEGMYVAPDDASAGNQNNNASYRLVTITAAPGYEIGFVAGQPTQFQRAAVEAWPAHGLGAGRPDVDVHIVNVQDPDDGMFVVGSRVRDNGDGTWHYEYAIQNLNHHGSGRELSIPIGNGVTITDPGFHDVDYHSGDGEGGVNFDGTDWPATVAGNSITWTTDPWTVNTNANALRWGTLYNFRFDADAPPSSATATIGIFRPGSTTKLSVELPAPVTCPGDFDGDGVIAIGDFLFLLGSWGTPNADIDGDGDTGIADFLFLLGNWGPCP